MSDCIFCKIVNKELPSTVVYEDERVLAFKDIQPAAPTHILVIPKQHIANIADPNLLQSGLATDLMQAIQTVTQELGLRENGFRVVVNYGRDALEAVHHLHFHIIAGRSMSWPPG